MHKLENLWIYGVKYNSRSSCSNQHYEIVLKHLVCSFGKQIMKCPGRLHSANCIKAFKEF